jgi:hypothetical protein
MATTNRILLKKSSVEGKIPSASEIEFGELALNFSDGRLYFKNSDNNVDFFERVTSSIASNFDVLLNDLNLGSVTDSDIENVLNLEAVNDSTIDSFDLGLVVTGGPVSPSAFVLPSSTVSNLPDGITGQMLFVTDEVNGAAPAFYDGNSWKRLSDNQTVTAT